MISHEPHCMWWDESGNPLGICDCAFAQDVKVYREGYEDGLNRGRIDAGGAWEAGYNIGYKHGLADGKI